MGSGWDWSTGFSLQSFKLTPFWDPRLNSILEETLHVHLSQLCRYIQSSLLNKAIGWKKKRSSYWKELHSECSGHRAIQDSMTCAQGISPQQAFSHSYPVPCVLLHTSRLNYHESNLKASAAYVPGLTPSFSLEADSSIFKKLLTAWGQTTENYLPKGSHLTPISYLISSEWN